MVGDTGALGHSPVLRVSSAPGTGNGDHLLSAARAAAETVPIVRTGPTGITAVTPLVVATVDGRTAYYADPAPSFVRDLVDGLEQGSLTTDSADAVVDHDPDTETLPVPDSGPLSVGRRSVLGPCGWIDPLAPSDWSFVSTDKAAQAAIETGLLGRGRGDAAADEPVADVWETVRETDGDPVVVVNANESNDRFRADDTLLAGAPMAILDGVAAIAEYIGAEDAVIYCNEADEALHRHLRTAIDAVRETLPIEPQLVAGPDAYRAGEPTAALEALEGADRIEPRLQPPAPATHGLYGRPTVVHTPRTVAHVQRYLADPAGVDTTTADPGTRLVTVTGDVHDPATIELEPTGSLDTVRDAVEMDGSFKMACVGGPLGGITRDLDVPPTARSVRRAGLGTGGAVELLDTSRCVVATAGQRATFAATENSGRCVPGREGTKQLTELLRDAYQGSFESEKIRELGRVMKRSSNCQIGAHAPRPVITAIDEFEPEFRAHADGHCPTDTCEENL